MSCCIHIDGGLPGKPPSSLANTFIKVIGDLQSVYPRPNHGSH